VVAGLRGGAWSDAVYAAGVLSHYYTDPIHPFHTGQTEAENAIHRACEWSINRSYDALAALGRERGCIAEVTVPDGAHWLKDMVCRGAETANRQYEKLIAHYDIHRGAADPPAGLDDTARALVGGLIAYAATGYARVLERAFAESGVSPPTVSLTAETFLATLQMPQKWIEKKLSNAADRAQVLAMYHELQATGAVEATLPADDRAVRDLYEAEVAAPHAAKQAAERVKRLAAPHPAPAAEAAPKPKATPTPAAATASRAVRPSAPAPASAQRPFLKASDDVEAAPSIGQRSAQRLAEAAIFTVADLIAADPAATAATLGHQGIDADTLRLWQAQAKLVIDVPGLRGTHAQLLTGAGYADAAAVAAADAAILCAAVLRFAATPEGQRILRQGEAPTADKIAGWIVGAAGRLAA
jgi:predicted flap endonuclease-1-like 5' DNA nuclease